MIEIGMEVELLFMYYKVQQLSLHPSLEILTVTIAYKTFKCIIILSPSELTHGDNS